MGERDRQADEPAPAERAPGSTAAAAPGKRTLIEASFAGLAALPAVPSFDYSRFALLLDDPPPQPAQPQVAASITEAIQRFKQKVDPSDATGDGAITRLGARFWARRLGDAIWELARTLPDDPDAARFKELAQQATYNLSVSSDSNEELAEMRKLAWSTSSPGRALMRKLVFEGQPGGVGLEALLWMRLNDPRNVLNRTPDLSAYRSFITLATLAQWEDNACQFHAMAVARRFKDRSPKPTAAFPMRAVASGIATRDWNPVGDGDAIRGDIVHQHAGGIAGDLRTALDAGNVIHARVLSGIGVGMNPVRPMKMAPGPVGVPMSGEHSIVIIGHDGGSTFVFNDANGGDSANPEGGFGLLHAIGDRLTTEPGTADEQQCVHATGAHGLHLFSPRQRRYQVLTLGTV